MSQSWVIIASFISSSLHIKIKSLFLLSRVKNTEISCLYVTIMCNNCKFYFHFVTHYNKKLFQLSRVKNTELVVYMSQSCVIIARLVTTALHHVQSVMISQDLVNDIGRKIISNLLMVNLTGLNII